MMVTTKGIEEQQPNDWFLQFFFLTDQNDSEESNGIIFSNNKCLMTINKNQPGRNNKKWMTISAL